MEIEIQEWPIKKVKSVVFDNKGLSRQLVDGSLFVVFVYGRPILQFTSKEEAFESASRIAAVMAATDCPYLNQWSLSLPSEWPQPPKC